MDPEALLEGLDDAQRAAVTSSAMPLVVLAPAGSGKTRVLTRRIAHRVATGAADPRHVLALTFTRKAAGELDDRLRRLGLRGDTTTGTFHAVAWGALRTRWADQGRTPSPCSTARAGCSPSWRPAIPGKDKRSVAADLATEIEWAKARMVTPDDYADAVVRAGRRPTLKPDLVAEAYAAYEARKQRGGLVDFDDLLALVARALEEDDRFAAAQRWRYRHLFVDELQDVNPLQFRLLEAWRGDRYDVTAVGDPQQAIYGWNGADAGFLLDIHRWWPPAEVIELERSYRSTPQILDGAASVLRGARQAARTVTSTRADGRSAAPAGPPDRPGRGHRHRAGRPLRPRTGPAVVGAGGAGPHPRPDPPDRRGAARGRHPAPRPRRRRLPRPPRRAAGAARPPVGHRAARHRARRPGAAARGAGRATTCSTSTCDESDADERAELAQTSSAAPTSSRRWPPCSGWVATTCGSTPSAGPTRSAPGSPRRCSPRATPPARRATPSTWPPSTPPRASSGRPCTSPAPRTATCPSPTPARPRRGPRRLGCSTWA